MKVEVKLDYQKILSNTDQSINAMLQMNAPAMPDANKRNPIRIVALLDCSGSMAEKGKLTQLKSSMEKLIDNLTAEDEIAVIWFSDSAWFSNRQAVFRNLTSANKATIKAEIKQQNVIGWTNIEAAVRLAANLCKEKSAKITRVLLLTDGGANQGATTPEALSRVVQKIPEGIGLSGLGYGDDWKEDVIAAMTKMGNGNYYYVQNLNVLGRAFATEIGGLLTCHARNIVLKFTVPKGVAFEGLLNDYPITEKDGQYTANVGDIFFEEERRLVLSCKVNGGMPRNALQALLDLHITYEDVSSGQEINERLALQVTLVAKAEDADAKPVSVVAEEASVLKAAATQVKAKKMADEGDWEGARNLVKESLQTLQQYDGEYTKTYCCAMEDNLQGLNSGYITGGVTSKSLGTLGDHAMRSRRGLINASAAGVKLNKMSSNSVMRKLSDDLSEEKKDDGKD